MPKAAVLTANRRIEIQDRPSLKALPKTAVVAVEHAGICSTDLALFSGDYPVPLPLVCGHEFTGTVTSFGEGVDEDWLGKKVTAEINNICRTLSPNSLCQACDKGLSNHCLKRTVTGIIDKDGAFAEEVMVPSANLHVIPDHLDPLVATLAEPMAAALQTFIMTPIRGNESGEEPDTVVVIGPGRLGILIVFAACLKRLRVFAVSRSEEKRNRALKFGAVEAWSPEEAEVLINSRTNGLGADIVVDATGHPEGIATAMSLVRPGGTISAKTTCGLPAQGLDMTKLVVNEINLQGSRCGPFQPAIEILTRHQQRLKSLITSILPLSHAQEAIESAYKEDKVILQMNENWQLYEREKLAVELRKPALFMAR